MKIAVTSDIHAPLNLKEFERSLDTIESVEYFFLLGDIIDSNQHFYLKKIYSIIKSKFPNVKIVSVFGNNEYIDYRDIYKREYNFMGWLDDEYIKINDYYIIGTEGILDSPTKWMKRNKPDIINIWNKRLSKIKNILDKLKDKKIIFLSHYAPVCYTVYGDPAPQYFLCSKKLQNLLENYNNIRYIFHGHSHLAKIWKYKLNNAEVYNVSFYIHKKPLVFEIGEF